MPKAFYTEKDIEDMVKRGAMSLEVNDDVVLTDLAYEKANRLGMRLVRNKPENPPGAPVRPYISQQPSQSTGRGEPSSPQRASQGVPAPQSDQVELHQRIRNAVIARLGNQVDPNLLNVIITRVLKNTGIK